LRAGIHALASDAKRGGDVAAGPAGGTDREHQPGSGALSRRQLRAVCGLLDVSRSEQRRGNVRRQGHAEILAARRARALRSGYGDAVPDQASPLAAWRRTLTALDNGLALVDNGTLASDDPLIAVLLEAEDNATKAVPHALPGSAVYDHPSRQG
jgi:hypothetical protein